ncbi:hypothetical protein JDV02_006783 [Purpureocillium takamizusanense]|uniref:Uncharacterized protein n=1 Tax=Purpureocillium takamizusanense TaxID=2060973 RepID=A0A9Q8VCH5_9HYPO|nr:uncharacterized protein JDV02_006783 [Purpureocillium takamizusanense]UNI20718.1 hypothetical protein JDV02_006783 [Purpureocillium takamizusanense]
MLAPSAPTMTAPLPEHAFDEDIMAQRRFKKHKALPRPRLGGLDYTRPAGIEYDLVIDTTPVFQMAGSQPSSPRTLKHESRRIGSGPDLPPTPPNHSRNSSSSHSALPSSPTLNENSFVHTPPRNAVQRHIATPPDQRSPPTPDVTPPGPASRPRILRPSALDRSLSRTTDSRTESFKTAREEPLSSDDEGGKSTVRPTIGSSNTSRSTILPLAAAKPSKAVQPQVLDMTLEHLQATPTDAYTPRTKGEFGRFDGDWAAQSDVEQEWDENLQRMVTVKKRDQKTQPSRTSRHYECNNGTDSDPVSPTRATRATRQIPRNETAAAGSSPKREIKRRHESHAPSTSSTSVRSDPHRSSQQSPRSNRASNASNIVEAILIDAPPQRQRTLRHIQKRISLREPIDSPIQPPPKLSAQQQPGRSPHGRQFPDRGRRPESYASNLTSNSISSGRARREVWKSGGIPVVVVPDRRSSSKPKSSKEPSLRSTSSRRSRRTMSVGSPTQDRSPTRDVGVRHDLQSRRGRSRPVSESDPLDQRTIDIPPVIPTRSSSLSAPTSRNASRTGSLTAESLQALNKLHQAPTSDLKEAVGRESQLQPSPMPETDVHSPVSNHRFDKGDGHDFLSLGKPDDGGSSKRYSSRNTPFSIASFETSGTAPEVSEALAVHMYPHQNSSVVMVHHSAKPSEASDSTSKETTAEETPDVPKIMTTSPDGGLATPPQQRGSTDEVDSPLRNPRPPPQPPKHPPAINFIPATPSGLTPAEERLAQLGNFYEATGDKPPRRPSLVRRAFSRRRHSIDYPPTALKAPGFLTRTFSMSRVTRRDWPAANEGKNSDAMSMYPQEEDKPSEEDKLHPYWRPLWPTSDGLECDGSCEEHGHDHEDEIYRYPLVDNRPRIPARSLSAKMKRTFAIFPARDDAYFSVDSLEGPERRTIRRTPSGNLRVMRRRSSGNPLRRSESLLDRALHKSLEGSRLPFWRSRSLQRRASKDKLRRASSISSRLEGIQNLPRLLSERRRERRTRELRQMISGPKEVRDGVDEVIKPMSARHRQYDSNTMP